MQLPALTVLVDQAFKHKQELAPTVQLTCALMLTPSEKFHVQKLELVYVIAQKYLGVGKIMMNVCQILQIRHADQEIKHRSELAITEQLTNVQQLIGKEAFLVM